MIYKTFKNKLAALFGFLRKIKGWSRISESGMDLPGKPELHEIPEPGTDTRRRVLIKGLAGPLGIFQVPCRAKPESLQSSYRWKVKLMKQTGIVGKLHREIGTLPQDDNGMQPDRGRSHARDLLIRIRFFKTYYSEER
jgi:hypothetical protein